MYPYSPQVAIFFGKISLKKKMLKSEILKKSYFPWQNKLNHDCFGTD